MAVSYLGVLIVYSSQESPGASRVVHAGGVGAAQFQEGSAEAEDRVEGGEVKLEVWRWG